MNWLPIIRRWFVFAVLLSCCIVFLQPVVAETRLSIGSDAPSLAISDWLQNDTEGARTQVTKFEKGKVYVVEFWATWCGPCIQSMPNLAKLQKKFAEKDVQIISVSEEGLSTVEEFLSRETKAKDGTRITFRELTKAYSLTADPDGSTHRAYTRAANVRGIPVAFIVGKDSKIEWIGHPLQMEQPLDQIVDGTWDRTIFAVEYEDEKQFEMLQESISMRLDSINGRQPSPKLIAAILSSLESFIKETKTPKILRQARENQFELLLQLTPNDSETVASYRIVAEAYKRRPLEFNGLNWTLYELAKGGHITNPELLSAALKETQGLVAIVPKNQVGTVHDTISHLQYFLGDLPSALETAKLAAAAPDATPDFQAFISTLEKEISESKGR